MIDVDESIEENQVETIKEKEEYDDANDLKRDFASGKNEENCGIVRSKVSNHLPKMCVNIKSSVGLVGCVVNIAKYVFAAFCSLVIEKSGINRVLGFFGIALKSLNLNNRAG